MTECHRSEDDVENAECRDCGSRHIHNNGACGNPECCGDNYDYCYECDSTSIRYLEEDE